MNADEVEYSLSVRADAIVVQLVAHDLAKVELAGSSPVYRSEKMLKRSAFFYADIQRRSSFYWGLGDYSKGW